MPNTPTLTFPSVTKFYALLAAFFVMLAGAPAGLAQSGGRTGAGYVVKTSGDTLRGWLTIPRYVTHYGLAFATTREAPSQTLPITEVRAFGLADGQRFVRRRIANGTNSVTGQPDSATIYLHQLVAGPASLYRYDYNVAVMESRRFAPSETVQYFVSVAGSDLVQLRLRSYKAALGALLKDCAATAVESQRISLLEKPVTELLLRYNAECHASAPQRDLRPATRHPLDVRVSLRAGSQSNLLYYTDFNKFEQDHAYAVRGFAVGAEVRVARVKSPLAVGVGVHFAQQRGGATYTTQASVGTTNAGETLDTSSELQLYSLQLPLVAYYTFSRGLVQPYLAVGITPGFHQSTELTLRYLRQTPVDPSTPAGPYFRHDAYSDVLAYRGYGYSFGGTARAGARVAFTPHFTPLLEVQYTQGTHLHNTPALGRLRFQTWGIMAGLEF